MKILWLISNPVYAMPYQRRSEIAGHDCDVVGTCKEGQRRIDRNNYDLVLLTIGTACGRNAGSEYTRDIPAVRTFCEINKSRIKKHIFLSFTPDGLRPEDEIDMSGLADTKDFLEFITTECREGCRDV